MVVLSAKRTGDRGTGGTGRLGGLGGEGRTPHRTLLHRAPFVFVSLCLCVFLACPWKEDRVEREKRVQATDAEAKQRAHKTRKEKEREGNR